MKRSENVIEEKTEDTVADKPVLVMRVSKKAMMVVGFIVAALVLFIAVAFSMHWWGLGLSPEARAEREVAEVVGQVEKLILLPEDETPIVATITDAETIKKDQPFYVNAQNGDVLLVFNQAQRAILYRPAAHRLINVAPIYFNDQAPETQAE